MLENYDDISSEVEQGNDAPAGRPGDNQGKVEIAIDNKPFRVRRGQHKVSELKRIGGVNPDYALSQVIRGALKELADDEMVQIRGGEVFFSNPRSGGAS